MSLKRKDILRRTQINDRRFKITKQGSGSWALLNNAYISTPITKNTEGTSPITKQRPTNTDGILIKR